MMKKARRNLIVLLVVCLIVSMMPMTALAKGKKSSSRRYKDVTSKTVDRTTRTAINYVDGYYGLRYIAKGRRLHPNRSATGLDYLQILVPLYETAVPKNVIATLKLNSKTKLNAEFVCDQLSELGVALGYNEFHWNWSSNPKEAAKMKRKRMSRGDLIRYIWIFATYSPSLAPKTQLRK